MLFKNMRIKTKLFVYILTASVILFSIVFAYIAINRKKLAEKQAKEIIQVSASNYADNTKMYLENALKSARILANAYKELKKQGLADRKTFDAMIKSVLINNPEFLCTWTIWEPEALDGLDKKYANTTGYDITGRFAPSYYREGSEVLRQPPTIDYTIEGVGDYYLVPKKTKEETITEPYYYSYTGDEKDNIYETSIMVPIMDEDKFLGVVGIDISLEELNKKIAELKLNKTGHSKIISNKGLIVADINPELVGKTASEFNKQELYNEKNAILTGNKYNTTQYNDDLKTDALVCYAPIFVGNTKTPWTYVMIISKDEALAEATKSFYFSIIMSIIGLSSLALVVWYISSAINKIITSITKETTHLLDAANSGKLNERGNAENINPDFRSIIYGINNMLDAVINPLNVAASYLERISKGDISEKITAEYKGDFNTIINNLNLLIDAFNNIVNKMKLVANGDLTVKLAMRSEKDELMHTLMDMVKSVAEVVNQVQTTADSIALASQEMSSTAQNVSQGASEQAAAAEEVSASMEEMGANIQQNSDNAQQTEKIAAKAAEDIIQGSQNVSQTLESMKKIAAKISIINDIAFQTNILALNAAVEAARAGEHGKGFAVVAAEVRKLAERSQVAAGEIDLLSSSSVEVAERSVKLLESIVPDIQKTARLVQEITASSMEQNSGAEQINSAITQLNQVTQQNAAAAEEMATGTEELSSQAEQLKEMIAFFEVLKEKEEKIKRENKNTNKKNNLSKSKILNTKQGVFINLQEENKDSDYEKF